MPLNKWVFLALFGSIRADLSFIAIGDWGGGSDDEPTTESQEMTAVGMQKIAQDLDIDFTLLAGDNFYAHGIACSAEMSNRFRNTFQEVYAERMPQSPFYVVAGNHDYGEGLQANVSSQLEYSTMNSQWRFPSLWYKVQREFTADGHARILDLVLIDTVVLCGGTNEMFIDDQLRAVFPSRKELKRGEARRMLAEEQWAWLEEQLSTSTADFLWVSGHYPVWSAGFDGSQWCLVNRLLPLLQRYNAHYVSGHDHMSEHVQHGSTNMFVLGAGKECCYSPDNLWQIPVGALKYMLAGWHGSKSTIPLQSPVYGSFGSFRFTADYVSVTVHAHNGDVLYRPPLIPRRVLEGKPKPLRPGKLAPFPNMTANWSAFPMVASHPWRHPESIRVNRVIVGSASGLICFAFLALVLYQVRKGRSRTSALEEALLQN